MVVRLPRGLVEALRNGLAQDALAVVEAALDFLGLFLVVLRTGDIELFAKLVELLVLILHRGGDEFGGFEKEFWLGLVEHLGEVVAVAELAAFTLAGGPVWLLGVGADEGHHGVPHLLGGHAVEDWALEVVGHAGRRFFLAGAGKGLRIQQDAQVSLHVVVERDHLFFEEAHQFRIRGDGGVHHLIDLLVDADAEDALPQAVRDDGGEARIFRGSEPFAELADGVRLLRQRDRLAKHHRGRHDIFRFRVLILVIVRQAHAALVLHDERVTQRAENFLKGLTHEVLRLFVERLVGADHFADLVVAFRAIAGGRHVVREGRHLVELLLRPFVEGMVVALGALHARAEEDARGVRQVVERHAAVAHVVADRAGVEAGTLAGDEFAGHLVPRFVFAQRMAEVVHIILRRGAASDALRLRTKHIGPVVEEILHVAFASEQRVDELRALVFGDAGVEGLRLFISRDSARDGQIGAAEERGVIDERVRRDLVLLPALGEQRVDLFGGGGGVRGDGAVVQEANSSDEREVQRGFHARTNAAEIVDVSVQAEDDNPRTLDAKRRLARQTAASLSPHFQHFERGELPLAF